MDVIKVKINSINNEAQKPFKATNDSAGYDLVSVQEVVLAPGSVALIKTGFSMEMPSGYEAQVRSRSGLALKHGVFVLNAPGTIDADYRGEVGVILANFGKEEFKVEKGMRIAQMVFAKVTYADIEEGELSETSRDAGGFGSTGLK